MVMILKVGRGRTVSCWVTLSSLATCWFVWVHVSRAADTLTVGQTMKDWEFRESSNKRFRLLFFSQEGSDSRHLGIQHMNWSNYILNIQVVWVANRDKPLRGTLKITQDGNLMLTDYNGTSITINADQPAMSSNTSATLLDTGNLVLRAGKRIVWQSFDYPSDTWLPGMKLGLLKSRTDQDQTRQQYFTSWLSREVPTPGAFTLGVDPNNTKQLVILQRGVLYWRSGIWNGYNFSYPSDLSPRIFDDISFSYFSNESHSYFTFTRKDGSDSWIKISTDGEILVSEMIDSDWGFRMQSCDDTPSPGCVTLNQSTCKTGGVFNKTSGAMDGWEYLDDANLGINDCKDMCTNDCSCNAYASLNSDGTGCKTSQGYTVDSPEEIFYGRIINGAKKDNSNTSFLNPPTNKSSNHQNNTSLKNPNNISPPENPKKRQLWLIIAGPVVSLSMFLLISLLCYLRWLNHCFGGNNGNNNNGISRGALPMMSDLNTELATIEEFNNAHNPEYSGKKDHELPLFSLLSIEIATNHFSNANKIGEGGFGPVYKGQLVNDKEIAVKRLSKCSGQGLEEFKNEIILISKLQHRNLVRLLGCCIDRVERILIYEYLPNKSLDYFLFDAEKRTSLDWNLRVSIIEGIAQGLLYLHKYSRLRIIHRDLKTSNILLDVGMNPKISDFGTAKVFTENESQANTKRIVGTYGYMSPEYAIEGLFSVKSDVFSFGVMMLEIISGKRNIIGFNQTNRSLNLPGHAWDLWKEGRSSELIDSSVVETCSTNKATRHIQVNLLCVQESAADRPTMSEVLFMLNNDMIVLPAPKQSAFYTILPINATNPLENLEPCSVNNVTISEVKAR